MQTDWKEWKTWKILQEMEIAYVFIMYIIIFYHAIRTPDYAESNINGSFHTEMKVMCQKEDSVA